MRALQLDFKQGSFLPPAWRLALLGLGCIAIALVTWETTDLTRRIDKAEVQLRGMAGSGAPAPGVAVAAEDMRQANDILQQLVTPWGELFRAVEAAKDDAVAVLSLQPDTGRRVLRIDGEARNMDALLVFIGRLENSRNFKQVLLYNHEIRLDDPERPVRFGLSATWTEQP
jgi:hypothetical protein